MNLVLRCYEKMQLCSLKLSPWGRYGEPHLLDQREFSFNFFYRYFQIALQRVHWCGLPPPQAAFMSTPFPFLPHWHDIITHIIYSCLFFFFLSIWWVKNGFNQRFPEDWGVWATSISLFVSDEESIPLCQGSGVKLLPVVESAALGGGSRFQFYPLYACARWPSC